MVGRSQTTFLRSMELSATAPNNGYPFDVPAIAGIDYIEFGPVTIFVGENGSGKSTIDRRGRRNDGGTQRRERQHESSVHDVRDTQQPRRTPCAPMGQATVVGMVPSSRDLLWDGHPHSNR